MRTVAFVLLGLGAFFGIVGVFSARVLAPLAYIGPPGSVDYGVLALFYSPLALAVVLLVNGFILLLRRAKPAQPPAADEELS
jgi:uncharacterized BrkB/YihY/UPF0761 family membrane protein